MGESFRLRRSRAYIQRRNRTKDYRNRADHSTPLTLREDMTRFIRQLPPQSVCLCLRRGTSFVSPKEVPKKTRAGEGLFTKPPLPGTPPSETRAGVRRFCIVPILRQPSRQNYYACADCGTRHGSPVQGELSAKLTEGLEVKGAVVRHRKFDTSSRQPLRHA